MICDVLRDKVILGCGTKTRIQIETGVKVTQAIGDMLAQGGVKVPVVFLRVELQVVIRYGALTVRREKLYLISNTIAIQIPPTEFNILLAASSVQLGTLMFHWFKSCINAGVGIRTHPAYQLHKV